MDSKNNKAVAVRVEGVFTEWYAPSFKDPYEDNGGFREYYDEKMLSFQPVIGPIVAGDSEYLTSDLGCLTERLCVDVGSVTWEDASGRLADMIEDSLADGKPRTFTYEGLEDVKITPYEKMPKVPEKSYEVYGKFAGLVKERVEAIAK